MIAQREIAVCVLIGHLLYGTLSGTTPLYATRSINVIETRSFVEEARWARKSARGYRGNADGTFSDDYLLKYHVGIGRI